MGEPTPGQPARYFHVDDAVRELLAERHSDDNRLGLAPQIVTAGLRSKSRRNTSGDMRIPLPLVTHSR